jgi:hypothetical protein
MVAPDPIVSDATVELVVAVVNPVSTETTDNRNGLIG